MPEPVDLVVDRRLFFDERIGLGNVGLWLVVVVVADEVFDSVLGKNWRNSLASCAPSALLGARTRVGRCTCSISQAIVADLPEPVMPRSV